MICGEQISKTNVSGDRMEANEDLIEYSPITEDNGMLTYLILPKLVQQVSIPELIANYPGL